LNDKTSAAAIVHQSWLDATAAFFQSSLKPTANGNRPYQQTGKKQDPAAPIFSKRLKVEPRKKFPTCWQLYNNNNIGIIRRARSIKTV
jgi:hypothetical protein